MPGRRSSRAAVASSPEVSQPAMSPAASRVGGSPASTVNVRAGLSPACVPMAPACSALRRVRAARAGPASPRPRTCRRAGPPPSGPAPGCPTPRRRGRSVTVTVSAFPGSVAARPPYAGVSSKVLPSAGESSDSSGGDGGTSAAAKWAATRRADSACPVDRHLVDVGVQPVVRARAGAEVEARPAGRDRTGQRRASRAGWRSRRPPSPRRPRSPPRVGSARAAPGWGPS